MRVCNKVFVRQITKTVRMSYCILFESGAKISGIKIADFYYINFHGSPTFVTKIFLKGFGVSNLIHIYHYMKEKQEFNVENIVGIIKQQTGKLIHIERFLILCLFDALIGNHDRHGRNLALIETRKGKVLSPFYDNPGYLGIEEKSFLGAQHSPRGKIYTKASKEPTLGDYAVEIIRLGYPDLVEKFKQKCHLDKVHNIFTHSSMSKKRIEAFQKLITSRYDELYQ